MCGTNGLKVSAGVTMLAASRTLSVNVFTAPGKSMVGERPRPFGEPLGFDPSTSTLIYGDHDAVLVDAMTTVAEAEALANWIALHNRNLETIYITHAHFDHFYGLGILLDRFPGARAIAAPKALEAMKASFTPTVERLARQLFPGQVPPGLFLPSPTSMTRSHSKATSCVSSSRAARIVRIQHRCTFRRSAWLLPATLYTTSAACTSATRLPRVARIGSRRWTA